MQWIILIFVALIGASEIVSYIIYRSRSFRGLQLFYGQLLRKKYGRDDIRTFSLRYAEHPFLAMTANPDFKNSLGEKIHNKYGFRHKSDFSNIHDSGRMMVYCAGGSSTYCNFIERNEDTWPGVLESEFSKNLEAPIVSVINGAVSGWTSLQSLIRFSAWVDVLKPALVIIYHGKNDFAPFVNSDTSIPEIYPDYGNVMFSLQLDSLARKLPVLSRYTYTGKVLYGLYVNRKYVNVTWAIYNQSRPTSKDDCIKGLERIGDKEWEFIISRYRSFKSLCNDRGIPILFVTQKVVSEIYEPYMNEINSRIKLLEARNDRCYVYDFASEFKDIKGLLYDSVHFTPDGARIFAEHVRKYIVDNILISGSCVRT